MALVLAGDRPLREHPVIRTGYSIVSPLHWSVGALGAFSATAGHGMPVRINSEPLAGGTAPITEASCKEVGHGGEYLTAEHTLCHHREVLSRSQLLTRNRRAIWAQQGGRSLEEAARARVQEILAAEPRQYLDAAQERELERIERVGLAELA